MERSPEDKIFRQAAWYYVNAAYDIATLEYLIAYL